MRYEDIVCQLGPFRTIHLEGEIELPEPLDLGEHIGLKLTGSAIITGAPGCAELILMRGLNQTVDGLQLLNWNGAGVRSFGGGGHHLRHCHISTRGHGYFAEKGAGAWLTNNHFNGLRSASDPLSVGMLFGKWDTAFLSGNLTECHNTGWRGGFGGETANVTCSSITIDRSRVGVVFEPTEGGSIANCRFTHVWAAGQPHPADLGGGIAPVLIDSSKGAVAACTILDLRASNFYRKEVFGAPHAGLSIGQEEHY